MKSLTKIQFLVLAALARGPMHPYAVRQEIIDLTSDIELPSKSTVRAALNSLFAGQMIEEHFGNPNVWMRAERGVPYDLTQQGRKRLRRELSLYHEVIIKSYPRLNQFDKSGSNGLH